MPTAGRSACACLPVGRVGGHEGIPHHAKLNALIGRNKFTIVVEGDSLFSLHKALNIGRTTIISYQSEPNVIEIFIELGKVINSHSYIEIGIK